MKPFLSFSDHGDALEEGKQEVTPLRIEGLDNGRHLSNLKCPRGHLIHLFPQGYRKLREDKRGRRFQSSKSTLKCGACAHTVVIGEQGYYSCEEMCDFDMCARCVTCPMDGCPLFESYEMPSPDQVKWQNFCVQTSQENYFDAVTTTVTD